MRKLIVLLVATCLLAVAAMAVAQESQPAAPAENQGPTYEQFQAAVSRYPEMMAAQMATKYGLDEQQRPAVLEMLQRRTQKFMQDNGQTMFEMVKQGQEMSRQMAQSGGKLQDVPENFRKQMAEKGLAMMDLFQKQANEFADELRPTLRPEQQQKLDEDRASIDKQLERGREQMKGLAAGQMPGQGPQGQGGPDAAPAPDAGAQGGAAVTAAPGAKAQIPAGGTANPVSWELYVQRFIALHKLDEVQKVQATDILKKYQEKAKALPPVAASAPAAGASQPSPEDAARNAAAQRRPYLTLFNQMRAELDHIPTPVQKQLAGAGATSAPASRPAAPPVPAAAQTQPQAK